MSKSKSDKAGKKEARSRPLTPKQDAFAQRYAIHRNGAQAAREAGYAANSAEGQASKLLRNSKVAEKIESLMGDAARRNELQVDEVVSRLWTWANYNVMDLVDFKAGKNGKMSFTLKDPATIPLELQGCITELTPTAHGIKVKMVDKLSAMSKVGDYLGMFKQNIDLTSKGEKIAAAGPTTVVKINHRRKGQRLEAKISDT